MSDLAHPATDYGVVEREPPEQLGRNLVSAGHLLASATAFFFLAFVFAYFYLRSLNSGGLWHPKHVDAPLALGTLVMALGVASAALVRLGVADERAGRAAAWRRKGAVALALGVAAVALQAAAWATMDFGPADGGFASVYVGWTAFTTLFVLGVLYWLETLLATAIRYRRLPATVEPEPGEASGDPARPAPDVAAPLSLLRPGLQALSFYWAFLAGLGVLAWILLYLA